SHGQSRRRRSVSRCIATMASARSSVCRTGPDGTVSSQLRSPSSRRSRSPEAAATGAPGSRAMPWPPSQSRSGSSSGTATGPAASSALKDASGISCGSPGPRAIRVATSRGSPASAARLLARRRRRRLRRGVAGGVLRELLLLGLELLHDARDVRLLARLQELRADLILDGGERLLRPRLH